MLNKRLGLSAALLLACSSMFACSSSDNPATIDGGGDVDVIDATPNPGPDADTRSGEDFTVTWGPYDVPSGVEDTKCMIRRVSNDRSIHVGQIHNVLGDASHHFIVYRIAEGEESTEPFDCQPFADVLNPANGAPLMVTQKAEETLQLPDGVAFTFEPNQLVRLELHYLNATPEPKTVEVTSTFTTVSDADFEFEADFLFIGNPDIDLAPGASVTLGPNFLPLPADIEGANIFGITGHTHELGTDVTVAYQEGEGGPETMLYDIENFDWEEPDTVLLDPPQVVGAGGGFNFSCSWNNTTAEQVTFGEGVSEEMCFFWAYYYPSKGARVCVHSEQAPQVATDLCCPGDALCALLDGLL